MLCLLSPESVVPTSHPLRTIKHLADEVLQSMSRKFSRMYSRYGRPSIPPETLLKSRLLMSLFTVRSDRQFCEQLAYNLLFRWFLDMDMTEQPFDPSTFSRNQERFLAHDVAREFLLRVIALADRERLLSKEHFSVDGTLIEAAASMKSFRPKGDCGDANRWSDFKGRTRKNDTHESRTDPEARLIRKGRGKEAKLAFAAHVLMENRNGLICQVELTTATGTCEREAALSMLDSLPKRSARRTLGADGGYDAKDFVRACRHRNVVPHVAQKQRSALDGRTTGRPAYRASQIVRKTIEQIFGWFKTVGSLRRSRWRGRRRTEAATCWVAASYNLMRMTKLLECVA